jgi:TRAP-type C4-dicarboxylate transport system substrate-binding protein
MKSRMGLCVVLSVVFVFLCTGLAFAQAKSTTIKFSSPFVATDSRTQAYQYWADMVEKETKGRVKVVVYPGGSLIPLRDHYHAISNGSVGGGLLISSFLDPIIPEFVVTSLLGTIPVNSPDDVMRVEKGIKPIMSKILEKHNIKYLFTTYEGETCFIIRKGKNPILKLEDVRGLILRDPGKHWSGFLRKLGASTMTLDLGQIVPALTYGTVDGVFFNWTTAVALKAGDAAPSLTYTKLYGAWVWAGMNLEMFKGLSQEDQNILMQSAEKAAEYSVDQGRKASDAFFKGAGGFKIYRLPDKEQQRLVQLVMETKEESLKEAPAAGKELAAALEKLAK